MTAMCHCRQMLLICGLAPHLWCHSYSMIKITDYKFGDLVKVRLKSIKLCVSSLLWLTKTNPWQNILSLTLEAFWWCCCTLLEKLWFPTKWECFTRHFSFMVTAGEKSIAHSQLNPSSSHSSYSQKKKKKKVLRSSSVWITSLSNTSPNYRRFKRWTETSLPSHRNSVFQIMSGMVNTLHF